MPTNSTTKPFRVVGRIVAARLPEGVIVPNLLIRRDANASRLARPTNLSAKSGRTGGGFLSASPSEITIESDALVELRVRATDETDAVDVAQRTLIRPLVAALMLATGQSAHVELTRAAPEDTQGNVQDEGWSVWSDSAMVTNLGPMPAMTDDETTNLSGVMKTFHHDNVAAAAAADLVEAGKMMWTTGSRPAEIEAAVLRKFHVIERVAKRVATARPAEPGEGEREARIVNSLTRDLQTVPPATAARRIRNAAKQLEQSEGQRLSNDIAYTCDVFGLTDDVKAAALNLNKLRNQSLAHPGKGKPHSELVANAEAATRTAAVFLHEYAEWVSARKSPTSRTGSTGAALA